MILDRTFINEHSDEALPDDRKVVGSDVKPVHIIGQNIMSAKAVLNYKDPRQWRKRFFYEVEYDNTKDENSLLLTEFPIIICCNHYK